MSDLENYGDRYFQDHARGSFETTLVAIRRRHVLQWLKRYEARRVLEVGCGLEPLFAHRDPFDTWHVVEPVPQFVRLARQAAGDDPRVTVLEGRLEERVQALASERFDFVVVSSVVHGVPNPLALLEAVRTLCGEETVAHLNVPNARSFHRLLAVEMGLVEDVFAPSRRDEEFGHRRPYDAMALAALLESAGFSILESGTYFVKPFSHDQMNAVLATGAFPPSWLDGLDGMTRHMPELGVELYANVRKT